MSQALGGLRCKINPGPRTHAASVYFKQKLVLLGGRSGEDELKNDAWYRDDRTPTAFVASGPSSYTSGRSAGRPDPAPDFHVGGPTKKRQKHDKGYPDFHVAPPPLMKHKHDGVLFRTTFPL